MQEQQERCTPPAWLGHGVGCGWVWQVGETSAALWGEPWWCGHGRKWGEGILKFFVLAPDWDQAVVTGFGFSLDAIVQRAIMLRVGKLCLLFVEVTCLSLLWSKAGCFPTAQLLLWGRRRWLLVLHTAQCAQHGRCARAGLAAQQD